MKTFIFAPVLLLFAITTSWVAAERDKNGLDLDKIAVRLILDAKVNGNGNSNFITDNGNAHGKNNGDARNGKGNADGKSNNENGKNFSHDAICTDEEQNILSRAFLNVLPEMSKRQLRAQRSTATSSCRILCRGFAPGHCFLVYSWCAPRLAERDLVATMGGEVESQPRLLQNKVSIAASQKCGRMKKSIEDEIDAILSKDFDLVSEQCMNLLDMGYKIACVYMEDED